MTDYDKLYLYVENHIDDIGKIQMELSKKDYHLLKMYNNCRRHDIEFAVSAKMIDTSEACRIDHILRKIADILDTATII